MDRFCHRFFEQCINHDAVAAGVSFVLVLSHEDTVNVALLVTIVSSVASRCHASPFPPLPLFPSSGSAPLQDLLGGLGSEALSMRLSSPL